MNNEQAYQLALRVYLAGLRGEPMPQDVPENCRAVCERTWHQARKRAGIK